MSAEEKQRMKSHAIIRSVGVLVVLVLPACGTSKERQREQQRELQIQHVLRMHPEAVAFPEADFDEQFTIQLQDSFKSDPRLFYTVYDEFDVRRDDDGIFLTFEGWHETFFRLRCSLEQVNRLLRTDRYAWDDYVVVFTVTEVLRPKLILASAITDYVDGMPYGDVVWQEGTALVFDGELVGLFPLNDLDDE